MASQVQEDASEHPDDEAPPEEVDAGMADGIATFEQVLASRGESPKATYAFNPAAEGQANVEDEMKDQTGATAANDKPEETATATTTTVEAITEQTVDVAAEARAAERKRVSSRP